MRLGTERGVSLVELMVGLAVGLFIVAVATAMLMSRLREHRLLLVESRLMQDLHSSADIIARDLRRAGYWGDAAAAMAPGLGAPLANPYAVMAPASAPSDTVAFRFSRDAVENNTLDSNEQFGFRLRRGVIEMLLGGSGWQAMTDSATVVVSAFSVTPEVQAIPLHQLCERACPAGSAPCGPHQEVRSLVISVTGRSTADAHVTRSVRTRVRLRNDAVVGACPV